MGRLLYCKHHIPQKVRAEAGSFRGLVGLAPIFLALALEPIVELIADF